MPPVRVVFDANVLISGVVFSGRPRLCLRLAAAGVVGSVTTETIVADLTDKLVTRFDFTAERAEQAARLVRGFSEMVSVGGQIAGVCRDPDDDHILDCAITGAAAFIVTGDKDLLVLRRFEFVRTDQRRVGIEIVRPAEFLGRMADL